MKRAAGLILLGGLFALLQTVVWPRIIGWQVKPDLILVLAVYIGLTEKRLAGTLLVLLLGTFLDAVSGNQPWLHVIILLSILYSVYLLGSRLNTENMLLLHCLVAWATLIQVFLLAFLGPFADLAGFWREVLPGLFPQLVLNVLATALLLRLAPWLARRLAPGSVFPWLKQLERGHGA
ncbi:MAG: hypothetical protein D6794_04560 [Deltaproteobacteria bacterium]|nr:MAG: hypothetical protein D6794_04560 [Deltaproteobacteria bacterium]